MSITPKTTLRELAFIVCTALQDAGTIAVLSGGGAATVYAPEAYQSRDLDFILAYWSSMGNTSAKPLRDLGFEEQGGIYRYPFVPFTLEFPSGPLAVGSDTITEWDTLQEGERRLHILSPTDCVRDRLCWFLFGTHVDYSALEQALAVAVRLPIDLDKIRRWAEAEGVTSRHDLFTYRYRALRKENVE